jgi:hypothetical protein
LQRRINEIEDGKEEKENKKRKREAEEVKPKAKEYTATQLLMTQKDQNMNSKQNETGSLTKSKETPQESFILPSLITHTFCLV